MTFYIVCCYISGAVFFIGLLFQSIKEDSKDRDLSQLIIVVIFLLSPITTPMLILLSIVQLFNKVFGR